jgi:hypothetical protein
MYNLPVYNTECETLLLVHVVLLTGTHYHEEGRQLDWDSIKCDYRKMCVDKEKLWKWEVIKFLS